MTFVRKFSGDRTAPIIAVYTCPEHGEFDAEVQRDENGEAPDVIECTFDHFDDCDEPRSGCGLPATWTPSPVAARVRRIEAVKGKWEKPERPTFLDTRELAEGMDPDDFQEKRAQVWERKRQEDVMKVKKGLM
jgi:hypothetical protein